jgi:hypothetical protein
MLKRWAVLAAGAALAITAIAAQTASAAIEIGDPCLGDHASSYSAATLFQIAAPESPFPQASPTDGMVTKWRTTTSIVDPMFLALRVIRIVEPQKALLVGESPQETLAPGTNVFNTRIPIKAGDHLGLFTFWKGGIPICTASSPADVYGGFEGNVAAGSTVGFGEFPGEARVPVTAVIEPDADRDGYGDETQDKCPQSAEFHDACPAIGLEVAPIVGKGSVEVLVVADHPAPVTVKGVVGTKRGSGSNGKVPRRPVRGPQTGARLAGGTQTLTSGRIGRFTLKFPKRLKTALAVRPSNQFLNLKLEVTAPNVAGQVTTSSSIVKLKGTAHKRPKRLAK